MTNEEKRIKIAEACGWKWTGHPDQLAATAGFSMPEKWVLDPAGERQFRHNIPDYFGSLDAMHDAEKRIIGLNARLSYISEVAERAGNTAFEMMHATAAQRAEAFGKALGLWK